MTGSLMQHSKETGMGLARIVGLCVLCFMTLWSMGCGGCGGGENSEVVGMCPDVPCRSTERCVEGVCLGLTDVVCIPGCGDGEICQLGECISGVDTCEQAGQTCDVMTPVSGDFYCLDWDGFTTGDPAVCSNPCAADGSCPDGEACFILSGLGGSLCTTTSDCGDGQLCRDGVCQAAACQPSECEGFLSGLDTCESKYGGTADYPRGATCQELPDGTRFCFSAGERGEGDRCDPFIDGLLAEDLSGTCGVGLACVQGECKRACDQSDAFACDAEGEECLFAEDDFVAGGVGFCGQVCTPFSQGECGEQSKCLPLDGERGYCVPAGDVEPFEACNPGEWQCVEGSSCVEVAGGGGRCFPLCNVTVAPDDPSAQVGERDQLLRDETCPQPEDRAQGYVRVVHAQLGDGAGAYDVYLDRGEEPWIASLGAGQVATSTDSYFVLSPGTHLLEFYAEGTPSYEAPLADITVSVSRDQVQEVVIGAAAVGSADVVRLSRRDVSREENNRGIYLWHLVSDVSVVRVSIENEQGDVLSDLGQVFLGDVLMVERPAVFAKLVVRYGEEVLDVDLNPGDAGEWSWYLTGTQDEDDAWDVQVLRRVLEARPEELPPPPRMLCNDLGNGAFGYCQESCRDADDYGSDTEDVCQGDGMGCYPVRLPGLLGFRSVCQPEGPGREGDRCSPLGSVNECGSGLYCLEYGGGDPGVASGLPRGVCSRLCGIEEGSSLVCNEGEVCQAIDAESIDIGQCGQLCEPGDAYEDVSCPAGLQTCKPAAILVEDTAASGDAAPVVQSLPSVCSASGLIQEGEQCPGVDCGAGLECLYARNAQTDLVSTLLSSYFGDGNAPVCRAYCDPFDEVRTSRRCGMGETCLVNFPWSADVGHCAAVVEDVQPFQSCSRPGESCGEDSVCVIDGGAPFCLRLCEYAGGSSSSVFEQSTCPGGFECAPLINDVGYCQ